MHVYCTSLHGLLTESTLRFLTETISRTDEGQPRPKYIINNIDCFYSITDVWSITITEFKKKNMVFTPWLSLLLQPLSLKELLPRQARRYAKNLFRWGLNFFFLPGGSTYLDLKPLETINLSNPVPPPAH